MRPLDRKLARDLWRLRGQVVSIALVVACGVMSVVTLRGTYEALRDSLDRFYRDYRFADLWAGATRAPETLVPRIRAIPGVAAVRTRVAVDATLDVPGLDGPATGWIVSIPDDGRPTLDDVHVRRGRRPAPRSDREVLVSEAFAEANGLAPGDTLGVTIRGSRRRLTVVGTALSPDWISEVPPGGVFPDDRRFGVLRMNRSALGPAAGLEGAFDEVAVALAPGASEEAVAARLDRLLEPYGGLGAYGRDRHPSHVVVQGELDQNRASGTIVPGIFLAVAAFLLGSVMRRMVATEREQIAVLKAFGYTDVQVGRHYLRFALAAVAVGALPGTIAGVALGRYFIDLYGDFFRFPVLEYQLSPTLVALTLAVSVVAATVGALGAVRQAVRLPPAEAMRPEAPAVFRAGLAERLGLARRLPAAARMILRNLERRPVRALASALGVSLAVATLVLGVFFYDAVGWMADLQFRRVQREDLTVSFHTVRPDAVRHDLEALPGVRRAELVREAPARLRAGPRERETPIVAPDPGGRLRRIVDEEGRVHALPREGLLLSANLARRLGVGVGDTLRVEMLEGDRREARVPVVALVDEPFGLSAYMHPAALHRLLREAPAATGARLAVDADRLAEVEERLEESPAVSGVSSPDAALASFEAQVAENLFVSVGLMVVFACVIAVGVVYNGARIALSERGRELASLRVLGFTRREVAVLLFGEQGSLALLAIPAGWGLGWLFCLGMVSAIDFEAYRIPLVISSRTYVFAAVVVSVAAVLAGFAVRRRLDRLDLISVLKTRE